MYEPAPYLRPFLWVPGIVYEAAVRSRNKLYDSGVFKTRALDAPVLSVGNVTLGGTGKTPLVILIAHMLEEAGATPALLTRGYKRRSRGMRILAPGSALTAAEIGDEAALIRRRCPRIWIGVHHDRYQAGREIKRRCPNPVFILDDGFQHRGLRRQMDVVLVDSTQRLESNRVFPLGTLRERPSSLSRAGAVVVTGGETPDARFDRLCPHARIFTCVQEIGAVVPLELWQEGATTAGPCRGPVFLVAGIGNPRRFVADATKAGLEVRGTRWLTDHGCLKPAEWRACWREAQESGATAIVTTEKDAVKVTALPHIPLHVAVQSTRVLEAERFAELIAEAAGSRK